MPFSIFAIASGANSYRGIRTFIEIHRRKLNKAFKIGWKRPPAHTAIRYILQGLSAADVEKVFREHAANPNRAGAGPGARVVAFDGKALKGSFDSFNGAKAKQALSAFAADTALVLAHIEVDEKSNEIPAGRKSCWRNSTWQATSVSAWRKRQRFHIVTCDAMHCQKNLRGRGRRERASDRSTQGQPAGLASNGRGRLRHRRASWRRSDR